MELQESINSINRTAEYLKYEYKNPGAEEMINRKRDQAISSLKIFYGQNS